MLDPEIFLKAQIVLEFGYGIVMNTAWKTVKFRQAINSH